MAGHFAEHDVERANALLDEMGLEWDAARQWRLRSDGKPVQILGEHPITWIGYVEPLLDLVRGYWAEIGVRFEPRLIAVPLGQTRGAANELDVGIWPSDGGTVTRARGNTPIRLIPPVPQLPEQHDVVGAVARVDRERRRQRRRAARGREAHLRGDAAVDGGAAAAARITRSWPTR